jgi:hypothetical protein
MRALHHSFIAMVIALSGSGCGGAIELDVSVTEPATRVEVDTRCDNGGCDVPAQVEVEVSIKNDDQPGATVEILQYRVDYDLIDAEGQVPFHAGAARWSVGAGTPATFLVPAAGQRQREEILTLFGYVRVDATGTLTLAGYDQDDEVVTGAAQFAIGFGDFEGGVGGEGEDEPDGGTP